MVSTRYNGGKAVLWLYEVQGYETSYLGLMGIVVDVTPEKRYAIWNHNQQHFATLLRCINMSDKTAVQMECDSLCKLYPAQKYYVIEFEYPGEES